MRCLELTQRSAKKKTQSTADIGLFLKHVPKKPTQYYICKN